MIGAVAGQQHPDVQAVSPGLEPGEEALDAVPHAGVPIALAGEHPLALGGGEFREHRQADTAGRVLLGVGDRARDPGNVSLLTTKELRNIRQGFENCREAIGWDYDIIVHCHWEHNLQTALQLVEAVAPIKPPCLEDPMPSDFSNAWVHLTSASRVPIETGENLARRQGFADFLLQKGLHIAQLDVRNTGGLLESKKIADLADMCLIPMMAHNTGSILCNYATLQWACSVRNFIAAETIIGRGGWMDDVIVHDGPIVKDGYIALPEKPGLGVEIDGAALAAATVRRESFTFRRTATA
jgi:L-alanine-DL-glutamate epimerase-like enolase superfamily enzyme